jgi:hypothetical protein
VNIVYIVTQKHIVAAEVRSKKPEVRGTVGIAPADLGYNLPQSSQRKNRKKDKK